MLDIILKKATSYPGPWNRVIFEHFMLSLLIILRGKCIETCECVRRIPIQRGSTKLNADEI